MGNTFWRTVKELGEEILRDSEMYKIAVRYGGRRRPTCTTLLRLLLDALRHEDARKYILHAFTLVLKDREKLYSGRIEDLIIRRPTVLLLEMERRRD